MPPPEPVKEHLPAVHGLPRPDPHARSDPHDHVHQVLDHEHLELGPPVRALRLRAGYRVLPPAHVLGPRVHPRVEVHVLVEEAREHYERRHRVQYGEDADPDHQLLQLVGFGAVVFHHSADAEEGHEAGEQEDGAEDQVGAEGRQDEEAERFHAVEAHVADAAQDVAWKQL